jgi:penicillin G amidase
MRLALRIARLSVGGLVVIAACRKAQVVEPAPPAAPPLPQVDGTLTVDGLGAPVTVLRDRWGIPHISATSQEDLFFAQGFVQAQDRLFQMDLWRRSVQGRLSEVLGANFIERDAMTRRVQFRGRAELDWTRYGADTRAIATAFARGVNAWIRSASDNLPEEFALAGWQPEPWAPEDVLNRTDAFLASVGADEEIFRARLASAAGVSAAFDWLPSEASGRGRLAPGMDLSAINYFISDVIRRVGTAPFFAGLGAPVPGDLRSEPPAAHAPLPLVARTPVGWALALSQARTTTGGAVLASTWVGALETPAIRYLVHLRAPGWNVIGATAPWRPGVAIGHNDRIAWSYSPARTDTQDVYVEHLNPANPRQVAGPGGVWLPMTASGESVAVKGRTQPYEFEVLSTVHGVIVAVDSERNLAYSLRWSGMEPGGAPELGALAVDRARSSSEFGSALARWGMPASEFVYADLDGRVAAHAAGLIPERSDGVGPLPAAGWTRAAEWRRWRPPTRTPGTGEPADGVAIAAPGSEARRQRLRDLVTGRSPGLDDVRLAQHDVTAWTAQQIVPLLAPLSASDPAVDSARRRLLSWDGRVSAESADALLYVAWEHALLRRLAARRVPPALLDDFVVRAEGLLPLAVTEPSATWFDGDLVASRNDLLLDALGAAFDDERRWRGEDASAAWGAFQALTFRHPLAITARASRRYNVGPYPSGGYTGTVFATWRPSPERSIGPVVELAIDLADWDRSRVVLAPGQSGAPDSPHFADLAAHWASGADIPLLFTDQAIEEAIEARLTLTPRQ